MATPVESEVAQHVVVGGRGGALLSATMASVAMVGAVFFVVWSLLSRGKEGAKRTIRLVGKKPSWRGGDDDQGVVALEHSVEHGR